MNVNARPPFLYHEVAAPANGCFNILQVFVRTWVANAAGNKGRLSERADRNLTLNSLSFPHPSEFSGSLFAYHKAAHGRGGLGGEGWLPAILLQNRRVPMGSHARTAEAYSQLPGCEDTGGLSCSGLPGRKGDAVILMGQPQASRPWT